VDIHIYKYPVNIHKAQVAPSINKLSYRRVSASNIALSYGAKGFSICGNFKGMRINYRQCLNKSQHKVNLWMQARLTNDYIND